MGISWEYHRKMVVQWDVYGGFMGFYGILWDLSSGNLTKLLKMAICGISH